MSISYEMKASYLIFHTRLGWMGILGSTAGLKRIILPQTSPEVVISKLSNHLVRASEDASFFGDLPFRLRQYLNGEWVSFADRLDLAEATPFQRSVYQVVRSIPHGKTRSYAWVAQQIEMPRAARAVGQALARNPLPIVVPCHRVVGIKGDLCGFKEGLEMKRCLLDIERGAWRQCFSELSLDQSNALSREF